MSRGYDKYMEPEGRQQELQSSSNLPPLYLVNHIKYSICVLYIMICCKLEINSFIVIVTSLDNVTETLVCVKKMD